MELLPYEKYLLTIDEAAEYSGIGSERLRAIFRENPDLDFLIRRGNNNRKSNNQGDQVYGYTAYRSKQRRFRRRRTDARRPAEGEDGRRNLSGRPEARESGKRDARLYRYI